VVERVLDKFSTELEVLERDRSKLEAVNKPFPRLTYTEAVEIVSRMRAEGRQAVAASATPLDASAGPPSDDDADDAGHPERELAWGDDFGAEDETLVSSGFDRPVMVHRYPAAVKAFYMKRDAEDPRLALCVDVLAPEGYGEVVGGGQREDDLATLEASIAEHRLPREAFEWYLDLRRYGSVPHAGFGLGLERTVAWVCGLPHVRETIAFPRMLHHLQP